MGPSNSVDIANGDHPVTLFSKSWGIPKGIHSYSTEGKGDAATGLSETLSMVSEAGTAGMNVLTTDSPGHVSKSNG